MEISYTNHPKTNKTNFGFNYETHKVITTLAIKQVPEFNHCVKNFLDKKTENINPLTDFFKYIIKHPKQKKKLISKLNINSDGLEKFSKSEIKQNNKTEIFIDNIINSSMLPDLLKSKIGFYANKHFYFPNEKSFSQNSFGINSSKNNAKKSFFEHFYKKHPTIEKFSKDIGMSIHYLQDVTISLHTQRTPFKIFKQFTFIGKGFEIFTHKQFESSKKIGLLGKHQSLIDNYKPNYENILKSLPKNYNLNDIFKNNIKFASQNKLKVKYSNKKDWNNIQQENFNNAVDSTVLFIKYFQKTLK